MTARGSLALVGAFTAFWVVALPLDRFTDATTQPLLGLVASIFLAAALWRQTPEVRVQVSVLVVVATSLEILGSIVWGAYTYRLQNLPLFVPAGHGLFYLAALHAASLPWLVGQRRVIILATGALATAYMLWGLTRPLLDPAQSVPDLLGFVTWAIFLRFLVRGRYPLLYAVSFAMTTALELYGTGLGTWTWSALLPGLWLPAGNPPTGIGAGYCAMDALTRRIVATMRRRGSGSGRHPVMQDTDPFPWSSSTLASTGAGRRPAAD